MKTSYKTVLLAFFTAVAFTAVGCSEDEENVNNNNNNASALLAEQVRTTAQEGSWSITKFEEDGRDETSDYSGYSFTFNSDGSLTASNGQNTVTGTWSVTLDSSNSSDDDSDDDSDDVDFNIFFVSPADFEELSDDWDIISRSDNRIQLIDISGGNGGTDYLTFQKN